jgi:hypothetical protein
MARRALRNGTRPVEFPAALEGHTLTLTGTGIDTEARCACGWTEGASGRAVARESYAWHVRAAMIRAEIGPKIRRAS